MGITMFETFYNPQWSQARPFDTPLATVAVCDALTDAGFTVSLDHMGGGCMAVGVMVAVGGARRVLVTNGDASLPAWGDPFDLEVVATVEDAESGDMWPNESDPAMFSTGDVLADMAELVAWVRGVL